MGDTALRNAERVTVGGHIGRLVPYSPGKPVEEVQRELGLTDVIKLASNESALGPSPKAVEAMKSLAEKMHVYPDAACHKLREAVAEKLGVDGAGLVFGNGSDDVIHLLGVTFLEPGDEVIQADPGFVRYEAAAVLNEAPCHLVPLTKNWVHDLDAMAEKVNARTRLIFIANPNNPTGTMVTESALEGFLNRVPDRAVVVVDEAYYEYAAGSPGYPDSLRWVREGRNVVVLRTFSKAYGLAGLRVGYGAMPPELAQWLNRTREPFNVNFMAQAAAVAALGDDGHVRRTVDTNAAGLSDFYAAFDEMGLTYTRSVANFVWFDTGRDCRAVFDALLRRGVITRTGDVFGAPTHLRVTVGTPDENRTFLAALREALA